MQNDFYMKIDNYIFEYSNFNYNVSNVSEDGEEECIHSQFISDIFPTKAEFESYSEKLCKMLKAKNKYK